MDNNDHDIIRRIKRGDKEVFKKLFNVYYHRLFLYAKSYVEDSSVSEDILQDLFFNIWEKRSELIINSSISSYLFRAVHNRSIQYLRHKKVSEKFEEDQIIKLKEAEILYNSSTDFNFSELQFDEMQNIIRKIYISLPEKTIEIFKLSREGLKKNKEIASLMNIDIKTVEYHISKALKSFREALKDYFSFS